MVQDYSVASSVYACKEEERKTGPKGERETVCWSKHIYRNQKILEIGSISNPHLRGKFCPDLLVGSACC